VPYMLVLGDKEVENNLVAVRSRKDGDKGAMAADEFISAILKEVAEKTL
ncbi:MAG: His/Gly/Thr/Pro-type tRNA ligase C-terminal domain-containing protein, partial [Oscillospiraceae bacterium]